MYHSAHKNGVSWSSLLLRSEIARIAKKMRESALAGFAHSVSC